MKKYFQIPTSALVNQQWGKSLPFYFISATQKENFEEFREIVYEAVRQIHITRFPYNKFLYPDYKDAVEKEEE